MILVQINSVYNTGSTGKIVKNLHYSAIKNNIDSYVFYGRGNITQDQNVFKISNNIDVMYHGLITRFFDKHGLGSREITRNLVKKLIKLNPTIIHLHNIHGYYMNYEVLFDYLKNQFNGKVIWTLHDSWAYTGHCAYYIYSRCSKFETHCEKCPQIKSYPKSLFFDNSKNNFDRKKKIFTGVKNLTLVSPSIWLKKELARSYLKSYRSLVINNGIDKNIFTHRSSNLRKKYNLKNKFIILGVASYWEKRKGFEYFVKIAKMVGDDTKIILIGKFDKKVPNIDNILFIESVENQIELANFYSVANVFFNPTLEDNYPTTNLEALACQTPVITFDTGGSSEALDSKLSKTIENKDLRQVIEHFDYIKSENYNKNKSKLDDKVYDVDQFSNTYIKLYLE